MNKKLKILVGITIFAFFVLCVAVLSAALIIKERNKEADIMKNNLEQTSANNGLNIDQKDILNTVEVAAHNTPSNCWMIINNKVYNVTDFLNVHPGGALVMQAYCGKDATQAFNTKEKSPAVKHSAVANSMLSDYFVGNLGDKITSNEQPEPTPQVVPTTIATPVTTPTATIVTTQLNTSEIAAHNSQTNCWIIISNQVYNVTNYLTAHPGGVRAITNYCGKDATQAFNTKGGEGSHSSRARNLLSNYLIGDVGGSVSTNTSTNVNNSSVTTSQDINEQLPQSVESRYPNAEITSIKTEDNGSMHIKLKYMGECIDIETSADGSIKEDQNC